MAGKEIVGLCAGVVAVALVGGRIYSRYERNAARDERNQAMLVQLESDCKQHAHELMDKAPELSRVGKDLHALVDEYHAQAWEESGTSTGYRDALLDHMIEAAAKTGKEANSRALDKLKLYSRAAGEEWWAIKPIK